ncbi:MAG: 4'-phosphopantetheinyl transferase superfamily protein [Pirellulaceae bacterium]
MTPSSEKPTPENLRSSQLVLGRVDLWYARTADFGESDLADCRRVLSPDEVAQAGRFRFDRDRKLYVVAHALVRTALSHHAPLSAGAWRFRTLARGKPIIDPDLGVSLQFNLSHTRGMAICGVTLAGDLGVDVEFLGRPRSDLKLARRYFAAAETATLEGLDPETLHDRFLQFWTLKESYIKAVGDGLAMPLERFAFRLDERRPPTISFSDSTEDPTRWRFAQLRFGGEHLASIALHGEIPMSIRAARVLPPMSACRPSPLSPVANNSWRL